MDLIHCGELFWRYYKQDLIHDIIITQSDGIRFCARENALPVIAKDVGLTIEDDPSVYTAPGWKYGRIHSGNVGVKGYYKEAK